MFLNLRAEAIKGILNIRQSNSATPGSSSVIQSVQGLSLSSNGESTPGSSTGEKRPHLTAKELEVLKYECINWVIYELSMKQWIIAFSTCETNTFFYIMCGSKNYPHLPHGRDFSLDPPPPLPVWKFQSSFIHLLKFWAFENLPPLGIFNPFCGGEYGYFLEPHNVKKIFTLKNATYTLQAVAKRKPDYIQTWIPTWMSLASYIVTGSWSSIG